MLYIMSKVLTKSVKKDDAKNNAFYLFFFFFLSVKFSFNLIQNLIYVYIHYLHWKSFI